MPKGSEQLTQFRKQEIVDACAKLYTTKNFKDITLKDIGDVTSFTRTSIYNYFQTKEEIFLELLKQEYDAWSQELFDIQNQKLENTVDFCKAVANSLVKRERLLKLLSMNHYDLEANSRIENLIEFKKSYGHSIDCFKSCVKKHCPKIDGNAFVYSFFPFLFGVYPYAVVTPKQKEAMASAKVQYTYYSAYELIYNFLRKWIGE